MRGGNVLVVLYLVVTGPRACDFHCRLIPFTHLSMAFVVFAAFDGRVLVNVGRGLHSVPWADSDRYVVRVAVNIHGGFRVSTLLDVVFSAHVIVGVGCVVYRNCAAIREARSFAFAP